MHHPAPPAAVWTEQQPLVGRDVSQTAIYVHVLDRRPAGLPAPSDGIDSAVARVHGQDGRDIPGLLSAGARMCPVRAQGVWPKALPVSCGSPEFAPAAKISSNAPVLPGSSN